MATQVPDLLPPTRLTGNQQVDQQATLDYLWSNYRALVVALNAVSSLGTLATQDASDVSITGGTIAVPTTGSELVANKDAASGYAGLSASYQVHFQNATGTFKSTLSNSNTAARDYVFPNTSGTVALTSDLSGFESTSNKDAASGYAGLSSTYQIKLKNSAGTVTNTLSSSAISARDYVFPDVSGTVALVADITGGALGGSFTNVVQSTVAAQSASAPTIASAGTIAPTTGIVFVSGAAAISTITPPAPISAGGGAITLIPTGLFTTDTAGNIALASAAVVNRALVMVYDATTAKWYPSY